MAFHIGGISSHLCKVQLVFCPVCTGVGVERRRISMGFQIQISVLSLFFPRLNAVCFIFQRVRKRPRQSLLAFLPSYHIVNPPLKGATRSRVPQSAMHCITLRTPPILSNQVLFVVRIVLWFVIHDHIPLLFHITSITSQRCRQNVVREELRMMRRKTYVVRPP